MRQATLSEFLRCIRLEEQSKTSLANKKQNESYNLKMQITAKALLMDITLKQTIIVICGPSNSCTLFCTFLLRGHLNISHLFIPTQQIHSYSTRSSSSGNYYISHSRLNQKKDSFSIMGAKIWNSIPENLRNSSKSLFKKKVHTILFKIFEVQDRYADLNTISSDFKKY